MALETTVIAAETRLIKADITHKGIIGNLMQFYIYDFSEYIPFDVEANGLFAPYAQLDDYWVDTQNRFAYLVMVGEKHAGFALVRYISHAVRSHFSIAEFFVLKKYRRAGMGRAVATQVFGLHRGQWEVYQKEANKPAQAFWRSMINDYTGGNFVSFSENGRTIQRFEN